MSLLAEIEKVMRDGRERTINDIINRIDNVHPDQLIEPLAELKRLGFIKRDHISKPLDGKSVRIKTWRWAV